MGHLLADVNGLATQTEAEKGLCHRGCRGCQVLM